MRGDGVSKGIAEGEVTTERTILWGERNRHILIDKMGVQGICIIAPEPQRHTMTEYIYGL